MQGLGSMKCFRWTRTNEFVRMNDSCANAVKTNADEFILYGRPAVWLRTLTMASLSFVNCF